MSIYNKNEKEELKKEFTKLNNMNYNKFLKQKFDSLSGTDKKEYELRKNLLNEDRAEKNSSLKSNNYVINNQYAPYYKKFNKKNIPKINVDNLIKESNNNIKGEESVEEFDFDINKYKNISNDINISNLFMNINNSAIKCDNNNYQNNINFSIKKKFINEINNDNTINNNSINNEESNINSAHENSIYLPMDIDEEDDYVPNKRNNIIINLCKSTDVLNLQNRYNNNMNINNINNNLCDNSDIIRCNIKYMNNKNDIDSSNDSINSDEDESNDSSDVSSDNSYVDNKSQSNDNNQSLEDLDIKSNENSVLKNNDNSNESEIPNSLKRRKKTIKKLKRLKGKTNKKERRLNILLM